MVDPQTAAPCCSRSAARCQQRRGPLVTADRARLEPLMGPHEALWRGGAGCTPAHPSPLLLRRLPAQHAATGTSSQQQQQHHHHQGSWRHLTTAAQRGVPHAPSSTAPAVLGTTPTPPPALPPLPPARPTTSAAIVPAATPQWAQSIAATSTTRPHPPAALTGTPGAAGASPLTVQYPFPVTYYQDREAIVYSLQRSGEPLGACTLPGDVFNVPVRVDVLHRVVRWLRAMWRQGTHKAKRRGDVRGGGKKPWPQKGTGRARHGSIRSPVWVGGGAAHGPVPRSHAHALPLPLQLLGYKCALSAKANEGRLVLVDSLVPAPAPPPSSTPSSPQPVIKTKATRLQLLALLERVPHRSALLVDSGEDALDGGEALRRGARNLPWVTIMPWHQVTVYHLLKYEALVMTRAAAAAMAQRLQAPPAAQAVSQVRRAAWLRRHKAGYAEALEQLQQ